MSRQLEGFPIGYDHGEHRSLTREQASSVVLCVSGGIRPRDIDHKQDVIRDATSLQITNRSTGGYYRDNPRRAYEATKTTPPKEHVVSTLSTTMTKRLEKKDSTFTTPTVT